MYRCFVPFDGVLKLGDFELSISVIGLPVLEERGNQASRTGIRMTDGIYLSICIIYNIIYIIHIYIMYIYIYICRIFEDVTYCSHLAVASLLKGSLKWLWCLRWCLRFSLSSNCWFGLFSRLKCLHSAVLLTLTWNPTHSNNTLRTKQPHVMFAQECVRQPCVDVGRLQLIRAAGQRKAFAASCRFLWIFLDMVALISNWLLRAPLLTLFYCYVSVCQTAHGMGTSCCQVGSASYSAMTLWRQPATAL